MLPDPTPPVPLTAVLTLGIPPITGELIITFDKPLVVGFLDERAFTLIATSFLWNPDTAEVTAGTPTEAVILFDRTDPADPGDRVTYLGAPDILVGQNGLPVADFLDFPVTVV